MNDENSAVLNDEIDEQLNKKVKRRATLIRLTGIAIALVIVVGLFLLVMKLFFTVKEISVVGHSEYEVSELAEKTGIKSGDMLFFVNKKKVAKRVLDGHIMLERVTVEKHWPDAVELKITPEEPLFYYENDNYYMNGKKAKVFVVIAKSQKVLDICVSAAEMEKGYGKDLPKVVMPEVRYAVEGSALVFSEAGDSDYIPEMLEEVLDSDFGRELCYLDVSCRFDIVLYSGIASDGLPQYEVRLGNKKKAEEKIVLAQTIAAEKLKKDFKGLIDVSEVTEAFARERVE